MAGLLDSIRALFGGGKARPAASQDEAERIGAEFRRRHTNFRLLLTAGKRLLSTLADMEEQTDARREAWTPKASPPAAPASTHWLLAAKLGRLARKLRRGKRDIAQGRTVPSPFVLS